MDIYKELKRVEIYKVSIKIYQTNIPIRKRLKYFLTYQNPSTKHVSQFSTKTLEHLIIRNTLLKNNKLVTENRKLI